ncbi:MAG: hypothetical protein N3A53_02970 [Verrucomicrobiae bacterium]|nr:hypothetical protein [Verrucomicrobiae bacterium]MCX7915250.1 hypothetical protein [Verrucomicrobiae bacterium]MDW8343263.1 hypothetical protein [Verrucomicrobiae bacterium]
MNPQSSSFDELRELLATMMAATQSRDAVRVAEAVGRLDEYVASRGDELPAMLRHYLTNRSYQKAWEYLSGQTPAAGTCR